MSSAEDRRRSPRLLNEYPLALEDERGAPLDDRALAHDISEKGFRLETQAALEKEQRVRFTLTFEKGEELRGVARVAWTERTEFSRWAGVEFSALSWSDARRLRRLLDPSHVDWDGIADRALTALGVIVATGMIWAVLNSPTWMTVVSEIFPKALATLALGWSLRELLRPRR